MRPIHWKIIRFIFAKFIHILAEVEAYFSRPGFGLEIRRVELKLLGVDYEKPIWVGQNLTIYNPNKLKMGRGCAIPSNTQFINHADIVIGDDFIAAPDLVMNSGGHDPISMAPVFKPIHVGNRVWCGQRVTILAGVTIGDDVVIGAGSIVTRDMPSNTICAGVPARVLRKMDRKNVGIWKWYQ